MLISLFYGLDNQSNKAYSVVLGKISRTIYNSIHYHLIKVRMHVGFLYIRSHENSLLDPIQARGHLVPPPKKIAAYLQNSSEFGVTTL